MKTMKKISTNDIFTDISAGEALSLSGIVYTARDAALRIMETDNAPPFGLDGAFIYFAGPAASPDSYAVGSIGPTTSGRMECYMKRLLSLGVKGFIGKGAVSPAQFKEYGGVYLCAVGGAGALYAGCVRLSEIVAYPELGCEAVRRLKVEDMPLICGIDAQGGDIFMQL
jgi:fumarate hydratase subunit beta